MIDILFNNNQACLLQNRVWLTSWYRKLVFFMPFLVMLLSWVQNDDDEENGDAKI